ncbi:MAG: amidohydrolase [Nocardioides sp.]|uniref:amidohydrolase family protein n=1 Tax=Nocardioides sp. TaxID=35761 RepID=UPI002638BF4E|nr:amidohydrolase family protein [Nocardioides sp.]MCW2833772.1 amidohydrolase [Nocardioides sp.]
MTEAADVRDWWGRLGLSGLVDIHTHFLPPQVMAKVRAQFDAAGPLIGRPWPLTYRDTDDVLVETLRSFGVERFTALAYAHKPGMADWLNRWAADFADRVPEALVSGTFFPEESAAAYVEARLDSVEVFKIHVQVGNFSPLDPLLDQSWGLVAEAGTPVVLHAGSGPVPAAYTGPGPVASLLARHPRLRLVIAHLGAPEYAEFLLLAESHERVHLDTTMAFTDFFSDMGGVFPADLLPRLRDLGLGGKVLLGSDFPNIPYPYLHQLESLTRVELGDDWLRAVAHDNAGALLGLPPI